MTLGDLQILVNCCEDRRVRDDHLKGYLCTSMAAVVQSSVSREYGANGGVEIIPFQNTNFTLFEIKKFLKIDSIYRRISRKYI